MPTVPHYPSDEPDESEAPDIDRIIDRIIGRDGPSPTRVGP